MSLVGKGPLPTSGPPKGPPPGAKIAIKGSGPPPGKVALPKPPLAGPAAATTPGSPAKASTGPGSGVLPSKPPLGAPAGGLVKPALPLEKKVLPKLPAPPAGTKTADSPPKALPLKSPTSPTKATLEKAPGALKQPAPGPPSPPGALKPAVPKPPLSAAKGLTSVPPDPPVKDGAANGIPKAAKAAPSPNPSTASKGPPGTSLAPPNKPSGLPSSPKGPPDSPSIGKVPTALAAPAKESLGPTSSVATNKTPGPSPATAAPSAGLASTSSKLIPPSEAKPGKPANAGDGSEALSNVVRAVARRLSDRKPEERDTMKIPSTRGVDSGALGGVSVPGGIPGFFLSVPPWPAPTPMPMDQATGWGAYQQFAGHPVPQISPYAAFPPQVVPNIPYSMMYGSTVGRCDEQQGYAPQQGTFDGATWPGYPVQPDARDTRGRRSRDAHVHSSNIATPPETPALKEPRSRRSRGISLDDSEGSRSRGYAVARGDEEVGKSKWTPVERHLNNIRGGYGEAYRPPEEEERPPRKPSARARRKNSSVRDDVYSGFRPYYLRDKKPFVEEDIPRLAESIEASGRSPMPPRKSALMTRPKDRTWDRWGSTGLTAPRKRTYQSLSELASCFANLEAEDQDDVISLLLLCRKLEQEVEKQHVVIDMLEHELSEAQKVLKFPPEWRTLEGLDLAGMVPSDAPFQATAATPLYIKSAKVLPTNVPDEHVVNFGGGVPPAKDSKVGSAAPPSPAKTAAAPTVAGAAGPKPAGGTAESLKKPPTPFKPKPAAMGFKKPVFKKA